MTQNSTTKNIIEGFEDDLSSIVDDFAREHPDLKLIKFFEFWDIKHMDCIFANRFDPRELLESISQMNQVLVDELIQYKSDRRWLVSFYILFCLNVKQHDRLRTKIRITLEDAIRIENDFIPLHKDAKFAWNYLKSTRAIDFVEDKPMYGPGILRKSGFKTMFNPAELINLKQDHKTFIENRLDPTLRDIDGIIEPYLELRNNLKLGHSSDNRLIQDLFNEAKTLLSELSKSNEPHS